MVTSLSPLNLRFSKLKQRPKVLVIAGPTGVGKTALSLKLAQELKGEIISADALQVYRQMDIGTAKASLAERAQVPHHLIDIRAIHERFNVADYTREARRCCLKISEKGHLPMVVGGSGFYIHSLIYGAPSGPTSSLPLRQKIEAEIREKGPLALYLELQKLDPVYAATITQSDGQKIARALEIIRLTNRRVSEREWKGRAPFSPYDFRCWFLYQPRDVLYQRIEARCVQMIESGLIEEVENLSEGLLLNSSAMQAIGYRQTLDFLKTSRSLAERQKYLLDFQTASRRYAKRQLTWFRQEPLFRWLDVGDLNQAIAQIKEDLRG